VTPTKFISGPKLIIGRARRYADARVTHHFDGLVDEAMIYDRALTASEVATLAGR
jgi:hypothetical protein